MRTWYEALEEDYEINLNHINDENSSANIITGRTLREYKNKNGKPSKDGRKNLYV